MLGAVAGYVVVIWATFAIVLIGVGSLAARIFFELSDATDALWCGLITCCVFLGIWNPFLPVTSLPDFVMVAVAVVGLRWNRRWLAARWRDVLGHRGLLAIYGLCVAVLAFRAAGPCEYYDTGLYGAQMVRWAQTYPAVFGVANVHGRLGFNSPVFLIDAAVAHGPWQESYFHLLGGFLFCVLWAVILPGCWRFIRGSSRNSPDAFQAIVGMALLIWSVRGVVVGTTTDEPATVLCLAAVVVIFEELERGRDLGEEGASRLLKLTIAATLLALAVTFKLSVVVFAFLAWLLAFARLCLTRSPSRRALTGVGAALLVLAPWMIARVILSGYPFFPNSWFAFPGDWRVPRGIADMYELWVRSWGRMRLESTEGLGWIGPWFHQMIRDRSGFQVPLAVSALGAAALVGVRASGRRVVSGGMWLLAPSLCGILFWLWKSPDPRFGQASIWCLAATLGSLAITRVALASRLLRSRVFVAGLCLVTAWCLFSFGWRHTYQVLEGVHTFAPLPSANVAARRTLSGLIVYVPVGGNQCWNGPLPCTPYFARDLELRSSGNMRWGFKTGGVPDFGTDPTKNAAGENVAGR